MILYGINFCECWCGNEIKENRKFVSGHNSRVNNPFKGLHRFGKDAPHYKKNHTQKTKEQISKARKEKFISGEIINPFKGKHHTEEAKLKLSETHKNKPSPRKGERHTEETKRKISNNTKEQWQDPEYVGKQMKARSVKQNKAEIFLESVLNNLFPNEYKFVGDGEVIIAGKCPDFININGQKKIIELFGDYWHAGEDPQNRINVFKPYGYETLIIWERELKDIDILKERLVEFH